MLLLVATLFVQDEPVDVLIQRLGSDSIEEREEATKWLRARLDDAQEDLERAAASQDPEVAGRAKEILGTLTPYRREVCAEMTHAFRHGLVDTLRRITPSWREGPGGIRPLHFPPRSSWPAILRDLHQAEPSSERGRPCPIAIRSRLDTLTIDLDLKDARFDEALSLIGELAGVNVAIDAQVPRYCDLDQKVTLKSRDETISEVLDHLVSDPLEHRVTESGVLLIRLSERDPDRY